LKVLRSGSWSGAAGKARSGAEPKQMNDVNYLIVVVLGYVIGSIPNGLIVGKLIRGVDIRQYGSGNIGATNAYRVLGAGPALAVLVTDILKGMLGVWLGQIFLGTVAGQIAGGIAAIAGHNWSLFLKFKGGRGVATGLGVIALLAPKPTLALFVLWAAVVYFTRYVSLGSILAAAAAPAAVWLSGAPRELFWFVVAAAAFVIFRHRPNIERLLAGRELKIGAAGSERPKE